MKFRIVIAATLSVLLATAAAADTSAGSTALTVEDIRKIVREEMASREKALEAREQKVAAREAELDRKAGELDRKITEIKSIPSQQVPVVQDAKVLHVPGPFSFELEGYGDMVGSVYGYDEGEEQSEGSRGQSRSTFDTERFVVELEGRHEESGIGLEVEAEFEHGGTGVTVEQETEEFGEFETEIEKGGEVQLEEFYLTKDFGDGYSAKVGRFYVAMGSLSRWYKPTDYLGVRRDEVEQVIIPGQWDEIGAELRKDFDFGAITLQVVNGLDSSAFGASSWVASGHQSRFEVNRAEDPAFVGRLEVDSLYDGLQLGASVYAGNTSGGRPKDDLDVNGTLVIGGFDYRYWASDLKTQGAFYIGHLNDAEEISDRNQRLSNTQGVERTPVGDGAIGVWSEWGYNVAPLLGANDRHDFTPFFRFDYYDTYFDTRDTLVDNPRFERTVYTAGLGYSYDDFLTVKLDWSRRVFGLDEIEDQNIYSLGFGFVY